MLALWLENKHISHCNNSTLHDHTKGWLEPTRKVTSHRIPDAWIPPQLLEEGYS